MKYYRMYCTCMCKVITDLRAVFMSCLLKGMLSNVFINHLRVVMLNSWNWAPNYIDTIDHLFNKQKAGERFKKVI